MDILLIFLISCFSYSNWFLGKSMLDRPLITGTIVGLAFGDLASGCIIGATIELALMGAQGIGAAAPPDVISGGIWALRLRSFPIQMLAPALLWQSQFQCSEW